MYRTSRNPEGLSAQQWSPARHWGRAVIAFVVALALGSAGRATTVQAAPAHDPTELHFFMVPVLGAPSYLCQGELRTVHAIVYRSKSINGVSAGTDYVAGAKILATLDDPNIAQISPAENMTSADSSVYPMAADFVLTAKHPGHTTVTFKGLISTPGWFGTNFRGGAETVTAPMKVDVISCKQKVKTTIDLQTQAFDVSMFTDEAVMTADAAGTFTGSTTLHYVYSNYAPPCDTSISGTDSEVALTGKLDADGQQLTATETFQPTTITTSITCPYAGAIASSAPTQATLDPLTFTVPASGGVSIQSAGQNGMARIVVVPEEDKQAAFNLGQPQARLGLASPLWAMLWNAFPGLTRALPTLR